MTAPKWWGNEQTKETTARIIRIAAAIGGGRQKRGKIGGRNRKGRCDTMNCDDYKKESQTCWDVLGREHTSLKGNVAKDALQKLYEDHGKDCPQCRD
jgi:hypothetical protein